MTLELLEEMKNADRDTLRMIQDTVPNLDGYVVTFGEPGYQLGAVSYRLTYSRDRQFILMDRLV